MPQSPDGWREGPIENETVVARGTSQVRCAQCGTEFAAGQDRENTQDGAFCRPCFNQLAAGIEQAVRAQGTDVNYAAALVGAVLGAAAGILVWWGFTALTESPFGVVGVVIGFTVGKGVTLFAGHKRSRGLQVLAVVVATLAFVYATYLVDRSFIHQEAARQGQALALPYVPDADLFLQVLKLGFDLFDLVFLTIVIYEAWKLPAPIRLGGSSTGPAIAA